MDAEFSAGGVCVVCVRGIVVWGSNVLLAGFFLGGFCVDEWGVGCFGIWVGVYVFLREEIGSAEVCLLWVAGVVLMCVFLRVGVGLVVLWA